MKLKKFQINEGGKFSMDTTGPVVVDFSQSKLVGATGDQEQGKSTFLELFLMACGQNGGDEVVKRLKNRKSGEIDIELSFVGKDKSNYDVKVKNGRFSIKREGEPRRGGEVTLLKEQLGIVGVSPMSIKDAPIDKIVKWLASYSATSAEDFEKKMNKIKADIKTAKSTRASANKSAKGLREYLAGEGVVDSKGDVIEKVWTENDKKYSKAVDISKLSAELKAAGDKSDKYILNEAKVKAQVEKKDEIEKKIAELQAELEKVNENIETGQKWLKANASAKTDYDNIRKQYDSAAEDQAAHNKWQEIKEKKKEMEEFESIAQKADSTEKQLLEKQKELQWEVIPDVRGVELVLEDTHEDEGEQKKAGFYYKGFHSSQLSDSEWLGLIMQILKKNKILVMVIEDISQYGSKFMATMDGLAKSGCHILYTEMARGQEELVIEYK